MNRRQRLATLVILQGFVQWAIQRGVIKGHTETEVLRQYLKHIDTEVNNDDKNTRGT